MTFADGFENNHVISEDMIKIEDIKLKLKS